MKNSELFFSFTNKRYIYNIMPIDNIESVISNGILCHNVAKKYNHVSVANIEVQQRRATVQQIAIHDYANMYFDARNPMLFKIICDGKIDEVCILAVSSEVLDLPGVIVTDQNAAANTVRFDSPEKMLRRIDFSIVYMEDWNDEDIAIKARRKSIKCAEVFVPDHVEFEYVKGAIVNSEKTVLKMMDKGFNKKIEINRHLFFDK